MDAMGLTQSQTPSCKNKTKGATDCSVAPGFVPSPRYFANFLLHDRVTQAGRSSRFGCVTRCSLLEAEYGVVHGAEVAIPGLVPCVGCSASGGGRGWGGAVGF